MMIDDVATAPGEIGERMAVGWKDMANRWKKGDPLKRREEIAERIASGKHARDVRGDRWQHVITREECAAFGIDKTQVVRRVARRVHGKPVSITETNRLIVS